MPVKATHAKPVEEVGGDLRNHLRLHGNVSPCWRWICGVETSSAVAGLEGTRPKKLSACGRGLAVSTVASPRQGQKSLLYVRAMDNPSVCTTVLYVCRYDYAVPITTGHKPRTDVHPFQGGGIHAQTRMPTTCARTSSTPLSVRSPCRARSSTRTNTLVKLFGDLSDAGDPLSANVVHD